MTLIIVRANNSGQLMNSKPCAMCSKIIKKSGIKKIIYSSDNNELIRLRSHELDESHFTKATVDKGGLDLCFIKKIQIKIR